MSEAITENKTKIKDKGTVFAFQSRCNKGDLEQQEFILLLFWRLQVQTQGVHRAVLPLKSLGKGASQAALLASSRFFTCSLFTFIFHKPNLHVAFLLSGCLSLHPNFPFHKDTSHIGAEACPHDLILTWSSAVTLFPNKVPFKGAEAPLWGTQSNLQKVLISTDLFLFSFSAKICLYNLKHTASG